MKKLNIIFVIAISTLMLGSCDMISSLGGSNLTGSWDLTTVTSKTYINGILDTTAVTNDLGSMTFNKGGDGTYSMTDGTETLSGSFDWFEKNNKVFINMNNLTDSIMTKNLAMGFEVITNTKTEQVWSMEFSMYQNNYNYETGIEVKELIRNYMEFDLIKQ